MISAAEKRLPKIWIISRTAAPVGEVTIPMRVGYGGKGRLRAGSNSLTAQLLIREIQSADTVGQKFVYVDLILPVTGKDRYAPVRDDLHTVFGHEADVLRIRAEHDRANKGAIVL